MKWRSLDESSPGSDARSLREIFAERKDAIAKYVPAETREAYARVVNELKAQHAAEKALRPGATLPAFALQDQNGKTVSSAELLQKGPLVLCVIRGRWCPFCVGQMEAINRVAPQIARAGGSLVVISPQTVRQSTFMHDQHKLCFPLLSDAGNHLARQCGLVYRVPEYQQAIYRRVFVNLPLANGDESWELPIPATYIVNRDGTVAYASVNEEYTERPEPAEVLEALLRLATVP